MKFANANKFDRKSGVAQWRACPERSRRGPAVSLPVLPQNRHPERSASQIYRVRQRLWRGVEGPRRCLSCPCCWELFDHRSPPRFLNLDSRQPYRHALTVASPSSAYRQQILLSGFGGRKTPSSMGKRSTAEVLRLRATSAVSRDKSVRRSAQDDDSVGG